MIRDIFMLICLLLTANICYNYAGFMKTILNFQKGGLNGKNEYDQGDLFGEEDFEEYPDEY